MHHVLNVFLERTTKFLLLIGVVVGTVALLGAMALVTLGVWKGSLRAVAIGIGVTLASAILLFINRTCLSAQRRIVQCPRTPPTPSAPSA